MAGILPDSALQAGLVWALWKVLDYLSARFLPGSLLDRPQAAPEQPVPVGATTEPMPGLEQALAAMRDINPAELQDALASLGNDHSPLVQCLAWALGSEGLESTERQRRLEASLSVLSKAESFALLAVLLHQSQQQA